MKVTFLQTFTLTVALAVLSGCGPGTGLLRAYVQTSPRKTVALMPFGVAEHQKEIVGICEDNVRQKLAEYGYVVSGDPKMTRPKTAPTVDQIIAYGKQFGASTVLIGRIGMAVDPKSGTPAVARDEHRSVPDGHGGKTTLTERVTTKEEQPGTPAEFQIDLGLIDAIDGTVLWSSDYNNKMPNWTLEEVARVSTQEKISELAETYLKRKL